MNKHKYNDYEIYGNWTGVFYDLDSMGRFSITDRIVGRGESTM